MESKVEQRCYRCAGLGSSIPCGDFTKEIESINYGLVLYDYLLHAEKTKSGQNVIILQNGKDVKLSSWNTQSSFENCIETCPRSINIYKRAKKLLKNSSTLGKRKTLGVCSKCGIKIQTDPSHCKCNVIFKKFLTSSAKDLDIDEHNIKKCLLKPNRLTTGFFNNEAENNRLKLQMHPYSDSYLNRALKKYYGQKSSQKPKYRRQVKIRPLFQSKIDLSKLYITPTYYSFLPEQKANSPGQQASPTLGFRKTRLRIRKQPHDQTFQFHFIFPSEKKDVDSRLQVGSSQLLHDIQANRRTNILEKKNFSVKTNTQTLPLQRDFSISSLQGKSTEFLHDIQAIYKEIKTLEDQILEERLIGGPQKKNHGAKTNKQTLPWQSDFSLFSLEGKALEVLHDIRAKYMQTKILEDKILDLGKKILGEKSDKRILLPWERDFSLLGLEGNSLELLQNIRGKYRKTKILENKILAEQRNSDLEMKNLGAKTNKQTLPWQRDSSLLGLEGNSLELLENIRGKYRKTKILENKILAERRNSDLEMKNLGAKTNKQTLPWQRDFSLLGLEGNSLELLQNIRGKYRKTKILENKILAERRNSDLEMKNLGAKTNKQTLPWQRDSSLLGLEGNSLELLQNIRGKYRKTKILENKILAERRNSDLEMKNLGAKTNKQTLPWQRDSSLLGLEGNSLELLQNIRGIYRKTKILENKILAERRNSDLEMKNLGAKTNKQTLPWQRDSSLLGLEGNSLELLQNIRGIYRKTKILENKILAERRNSDLEMKKLGAKTNKQTLPWQRDSLLLGLEGNSSELLQNIRGKYRKTKILENKILAERRNSDLEIKNLGAKTNKQTLPWQRDSSLLDLEGNSLELLQNTRGKYRKTKILDNKILAERRKSNLEMKNLGAKTNKQTLPWQRDSSLLDLEGNSLELLQNIRGKYRKTKILENKILAERRNSDLKMKNLGAKTNKQTLPLQRDFSLLGLEGNSLDLLQNERGNYRKIKILENKILAERRNSDLEMKNLAEKTNKQKLPWQKDSSLLSLKENSLELLNNIQAKYENKKRQLELIRDFGKKSLDSKTKKHGLPWQKDSSLLSIEGKYGKQKRRLEDQLSRDLERTESKNLGATTKKYKLPWQKSRQASRQKNGSLLKLEAKHEEKQKHSEVKLNRDFENKVPDVKTKKHELPWQKDYSLLNLEVNNEEKQKHLKKQRSKDQKKNYAKTKDNGLPWQKDSSLLYLEAKYEKKERHLKKQHSKDLVKKKHGAKTKEHGLSWQKDSSLLSIEGKYGKKKRRLEDQLSRDLERNESKNLGATTKKYKLPWQKKDTAHLNLEEETVTITQANVINEEQSKRYHKKKRVLNEKEDSFNELTDSNSEINVKLVIKTSEEIDERRKKKEAILELLTKEQRKNISGTSLTLSHRRFLDTDSNKLLTERSVRKMYVYRMHLSRPEFDWFAKNKDKREMFYDSGETFATFSENGCVRWFYRDGKLALDYYKTEKTLPGRRYVVYSSGKPDKKGHPRPQTILATFDHSGNAVVFDHAGNIRLKYDQNEGIVLDHSIGPESHWKWHSLDYPPAKTNTEMPFIHPEKQMTEEDGLGKENEPTHKQRVHKLKLKKSVIEKSKNITQSYKRYEIKMKALKINEKFSLKILGQGKVYLIYSDDTINIKINIGMTLNRTEIMGTETYIGDVFNPLEKFPADTQSVEELQQMVAEARYAERARVRREYRLMRPAIV